MYDEQNHMHKPKHRNHPLHGNAREERKAEVRPMECVCMAMYV